MQNAHHESTEVKNWPNFINLKVFGLHVFMRHSDPKKDDPAYEYVFVYNWIFLDNNIKSTKNNYQYWK